MALTDFKASVSVETEVKGAAVTLLYARPRQS